MKGAITRDNIEWFEPFMTKPAAELILSGKPVYAVGVCDEKTKVVQGALVAYYKEKTFHIVSLFVSSSCRRYGCGNELIGDLLADNWLEGTRLEISFSGHNEETDSLIAFLDYWDFEEEDISEGEIYEVSLEQAITSEYNKPIKTENVIPLRECPELILKELSRKAYDMELPVPEGGFLAPSLEKNISVVYVQNQKPMGYLVFDHSLEGRLTLSALASFDNKPYTMAEMLVKAIELCKANYPLDTLFYMQAINSVSRGLIQKVFPEAINISHNYVLMG